MRSGILALLFVIIVGVILAQIWTNPEGTKAVGDTLTSWWSTSINGLLARTSPTK